MSAKGEQEFNQIVDSGLEEILSGKASIEDVVERNPAIASTLRSELETALWLFSKREEIQTRPGYIAASKQRLTRRIQQEASQRGAKRAFWGFQWPLRFSAVQWVAAILIVVIFFSSTGGVVSAAQGSIPGEELYPVKRFSEQVAFDLTMDLVQKVELSSHFAERRLVEIEALILRTQYALAKQTLEDFKTQVRITVELLDKVSDSTVKLALADKLATEFMQRAARLQVLMANVPTDLHDELASAREVSIASAVMIGDVSDSLIERLDLATDTPSPTFTLTATPSSTASPTLRFTSTPIIIVVTPQPDSVLVEPEPEKTNSSDRRYIKPGLTKTSLPSYDNKPVKDPKDPKPPKENK